MSKGSSDEIQSETPSSSISLTPSLMKTVKALLIQVLTAMLQKLVSDEVADLRKEAPKSTTEAQQQVVKLERELETVQVQVAQLQSAKVRNQIVEAETDAQQQAKSFELELENAKLQLQVAQMQKAQTQEHNLALERKCQAGNKALEDANDRSSKAMKDKDLIIRTMQAHLTTKEQELQDLHDLRNKEIVPGTIQDLERLENELIKEKAINQVGHTAFNDQKAEKEDL